MLTGSAVNPIVIATNPSGEKLVANANSIATTATETAATNQLELLAEFRVRAPVANRHRQHAHRHQPDEPGGIHANAEEAQDVMGPGNPQRGCDVAVAGAARG